MTGKILTNCQEVALEEMFKKPKAIPMTAPDILAKAIHHMEDRAATYDKPEGERSMGRAVEMFNAAKGRKVLSESDGWLLLALLKIVRDQQREEPHQDSLEDGPAYLSLYGEARLKGL